MSRKAVFTPLALVSCLVIAGTSVAQIGVPVIVHPTLSATVGATVVFSGSNDPSALAVDVRIDGSLNTATVNGTSWAFRTTLTDGVHTVDVRAGDGSTYSAFSTAQSITVDSVSVPATTSPPSGVSPTAAVIAMEWSSAPTAVSYNVYRNDELVVNVAVTSFTESAVLADGTYSYSVAAIDQFGFEGSVSFPRDFQQNATWPSNVMTVGSQSGDGFGEIDAAVNWIASHSLTNQTILVHDGFYQPFAAYNGVRIHAVPGSSVVVDTSTAGAIVSGGAASESFEVVGISFVGSATPQFDVSGCSVPVVLESCGFSGSAGTAVNVSGSRSVSIQRCTISGNAPLVLGGYSLASMIAGSLTTTGTDAVTLSQASQLFSQGATVSGNASVSPNSQFVTLGGTPMEIDAPCTVTAGVTFQLTFRGPASQVWGLFAHGTTSLGYAYNPWASIDGALLLDSTSVVLAYAGMTDVAGQEQVNVSIPNDSYFRGYPLQVQAVGFEPTASAWSLSNELTVVAIP